METRYNFITNRDITNAERLSCGSLQRFREKYPNHYKKARSLGLKLKIFDNDDPVIGEAAKGVAVSAKSLGIQL